jgi:hypothetical protein
MHECLLQDEHHSTWSEFKRTVKICKTPADLAERLEYLASQVMGSLHCST